MRVENGRWAKGPAAPVFLGPEEALSGTDGYAKGEVKQEAELKNWQRRSI